MLAIGNIVFVSYNEKIGEITDVVERNGQTLYRVKWNKGEVVFHEKFVKLASEQERASYLNEKKAREFLKKRKDELANLTFRYYETSSLSRSQKESLRNNGYFCYDLRSWDEGSGFDIEPHVTVNNIGSWITDLDLTPYMNENGAWIGIDELEDAILDELPRSEIAGFLYGNKTA